MIENVKATLKGVETIQANIKVLLKTLPELPAEAGSLGMKAPKALKSIKATGGMIKALPYFSSQTYCPVWHLKKWLELSTIKSGPLFRRFSKSFKLMY